MKKERKGIILAGGTGSRLYPITKAVSKQLMPVYDKPMIFYPLTTLMLTGIREILIITTPKDYEAFNNLLGDGSSLGLNINYTSQPRPDGIAQAFLLGKKFLNNSPSALILGDNLFHGHDLGKKLQQYQNKTNQNGASIIAYPTNNPERYAVVEFDKSKKVINIEEKPLNPKSRFAITGLYFYDNTVVDRVKELRPSSRGELEITDLNNLYLNDDQLWVEKMGRGMVWLDTGTFDSLHEACGYIRTLEHRQGIKIGCPEEVAWRMGFIDDNQLEKIASSLLKSKYGEYLMQILEDK